MRLRGIEFGRVLCSSGARGFFGDGYWWHGAMRPFGLDYAGSTFVAKTTTLTSRTGNMELLEDGVTPAKLVPGCVKVRPLRGTVLNAVGLSGPGAKALLAVGRWQRRDDPFFISFMSVEPTPEARLEELRDFIALLRPEVGRFDAPFGLEINMSCPNVGVEHGDLVREAVEAVRAAATLRIPVVPNFGPDVPVMAALEIAAESPCDAISVSNTVKWGKLPADIDWRQEWGEVSPLWHLGGGGISGKPLRPVVLRWVREARARLSKPLVAGGGVLAPPDALELLRAGANAVKLGTVSVLRPWRVRSIIRTVASFRG